jgi:MerR family redox-sensitive transcriptional activator SoxR
MGRADGILTMGAFARRAGVAPSTLRYYERLGLTPPAERLNGRRVYPHTMLDRISFIRLCCDSGFTLAEIGRLLGGTPGRRRAWASQLLQKVQELEDRIREAQRAKELLEHALACPSPDILACPRFQSALRAQRGDVE